MNTNYEETVQQLDVYYGIVKRQLLRCQHPITGLFPALSNDNQVASIRDSIYCAAAIWSLFQAYRRIDDDRGKCYELSQATVKCMRGILECWVRQAPRIEMFKKKQCSDYALHSKFNLQTGVEIYSDGEFSHLQIDVISLYLLFLVQMITSGLQIIYTQDEVCFVQNLVYYVERAYRTPDYGMWESENRISAEIHASSIGMAKSALEAINGCNLFGDKGSSYSVIYVDIDAHNRNRSIFESLLPRESSSKDTDAALIPTLYFPAFASHESGLCLSTFASILNNLKGEYGFRRFKTPSTKDEVDKLDAEWPLFFMFMIISGVFRNDKEQVDEYMALLEKVTKYDADGDAVIPMYYYFDDLSSEESVLTSVEGNGNGGPLFLWNQALYTITQLLTSSLLHVNQLDPIRRFLPSYNRPRKTDRYSAFQGTATDLVVQVVLITESMRLQAMMATYGIETQTPHQVEPVLIWSPKQLEQVYKYLGVNEKLNLSGRPMRPIGALGTSKIYRISSITVLSYPLIFEVSEFYLYRDMELLIDDIKTEMRFVSTYWRLSGRPTVCLLIREEHIRDVKFNKMVDLLAMLKNGYCDGIKVRIGRLQNLLSSSCIEHLDFVRNRQTELDECMKHSFRQLCHDYIGYQSLTDIPKSCSYAVEGYVYVEDYRAQPIYDLIDAIRGSSGVYKKAKLLAILLDREGGNYEFSGQTVHEHIKQLYYEAALKQYWMVVRYCASLLHYMVDSISPFITSVLVSGRQLTVGVMGEKEIVLDKPMTPMEIYSVIYGNVQKYNIVEAVLQQEVLLYCGRLVATNAIMFKGILKIRVGWVLEAMRQYLIIRGQEAQKLENLSPYKIRRLLFEILSLSTPDATHPTNRTLSVLQRRKLEGCWCRVPDGFYKQVWDVMNRTVRGVWVQGHSFGQEQKNDSQMSFAFLVEETLMHVKLPEYRQLIVELLRIVSTILMRNPELTFREQLNLDTVIEEACQMYSKDNKLHSTDLEAFLNTEQGITSSYLARAVVNNLLKGTGQLETGSTCVIS